jgi:hypothetical protein
MCCDVKVCGILLGRQGGYTKFPYFLCEWDSRDRERHWTVTRWPERKKNLVPGTKNVTKPTLIDPQKVLLPPVHTQLRIMKQFVKL